MIQQNELRVGNWVWQLPKNLAQLGNVPEAIIQVTAYDIHLQNVNSLIEYSPIPLTSEMLERCGFKKWGKTRDYAYKGIILHGRQRGFVLRKSVPTIQSVHQLQNLFFALTGTELQINLTTP